MDIEKNPINFSGESSSNDLDPVLSQHTEEYNFKVAQGTPVAITEGHRLKRDLKARHISMIAIGGALGTGLIIGTGSALANAGPASILIAYSIVGFVVWTVMCCLGEMATFIALPEGFAGYASRYCSESLGFAVGYSYLFKYLIVTPNQLTAGALVIQYWISRERVNPGVWITVILVLIMCINYFGVKFFGEFEFWLSAFKVIIVCGLIILLICITAGVGDSGAIGFRYYHNPGAFKPYTNIAGDKGKFVAFVSVLVTAVFAFLGTELVGVTVGEAYNPRKAIPKAIRLTFYRIVIFYLVSVFLLGMCVGYNDPLLLSANKSKTSASASPFVVAIVNAGIPVLPHIINACILIFIFSASNSDLYIASRTLYGLAADGKAPKIFTKTNKRGVPVYALAFSFLFCLLAYMNVSSGSGTIFTYFVNVVSIFGLLTWVSILITYIYFRRAILAQGVNRRDLSYRAPLQPWGCYVALFLCVLISFIKNFTVFVGHGPFDYKTFITGYIGLPVYVISFGGYWIIKKDHFVKPEEADLLTYKDVIDAEQQEFLRLQMEKKARRSSQGFKRDKEWYYDTFIGWLF